MFPCQIKTFFCLFVSRDLLWSVLNTHHETSSPPPPALLELNEIIPRKEFASGYFMQPFWRLRAKIQAGLWRIYNKLTDTVKKTWKCSSNEQYMQLLKAGPSVLIVHVTQQELNNTSTSVGIFSLPSPVTLIEIYLPPCFLYTGSYFINIKRLLPTMAATKSTFTWVHSSWSWFPWSWTAPKVAGISWAEAVNQYGSHVLH